jgi:hypothetical protein
LPENVPVVAVNPLTDPVIVPPASGRYGLTQPLPELSRTLAKKADWARK